MVFAAASVVWDPTGNEQMFTTPTLSCFEPDPKNVRLKTWLGYSILAAPRDSRPLSVSYRQSSGTGADQWPLASSPSQRVPSLLQFQVFLKQINSSLVDSNMLVRCVTLSLDRFENQVDMKGEATTVPRQVGAVCLPDTWPPARNC